MSEIGEGSSGDARDVEAIVATLRAAGHALERRDPDGVVAMFDPQETTTLFDFLAPGVTTVDDIRRNAAAIAKDAIGEIVCRYPKVTVRILSPDIAVSLAYTKIDISTGDGNRLHLHPSVTDVWRRINGKPACTSTACSRSTRRPAQPS